MPLIESISFGRLTIVATLVGLLGFSGVAVGLGFMLGESKEDLELVYDVKVKEHDGNTSIVFTLTDEGRLKPLDDIQFRIPSRKKNERGGHGYDLVVSIKLREHEGKQIGRIQILTELAERGEIWLNTHTKDGKLAPMTRMHHVIKVGDYIGDDF